MQHSHFEKKKHILEHWIVTNVLKCAAPHYEQNPFTTRPTLYPTRGILPSSRRKSDILFEHYPLLFSSYKNINAQTHMITNYFGLNATNSTAS
jgi:hypothetical protein